MARELMSLVGLSPGAQICDRIMMMKSGVVVEQGRTAEFFAAPQHRYTKALFEAPQAGPMSSPAQPSHYLQRGQS